MANTTLRQIRLLTGQTLQDVAIQEYGHTDGYWLLLDDNPSIVGDLSSVPAPGTVVNIRVEVPELGPSNRAIAAEFARTGRKVVSGMPSTATIAHYVEPGYWQDDYSETLMTN